MLKGRGKGPTETMEEASQIICETNTENSINVSNNCSLHVLLYPDSGYKQLLIKICGNEDYFFL
jgi:hypothetical protein